MNKRTKDLSYYTYLTLLNLLLSDLNNSGLNYFTIKLGYLTVQSHILKYIQLASSIPITELTLQHGLPTFDCQGRVLPFTITYVNAVSIDNSSLSCIQLYQIISRFISNDFPCKGTMHRTNFSIKSYEYTQ